MRAVFDTNILIDCLNGVRPAAELLASAEEPFLSVLTRIEVLVGARTAEDEAIAAGLMDGLQVVDVEAAIVPLAVETRRATRLKLPDAIILATARRLSCPLVTRNTRDFDPADPNVLVPYEL